MSYGNYAPFYRGGYFNPMQTPTMPNMAENQYGYQQQTMPAQQPIYPTQATNDMIFVLNLTEATSYPVAPGNSVTLWDKNDDTVYIKSVNAQGVPSMRILDYTERTPENAPKTPEKHVCECGKEFVRIKDFEAFHEEFNALSKKVEELTAIPATVKAKTKAKEDAE